MGLLDGFLTPDATGYQDRQTNRRLAVKADARADDANTRADEANTRAEAQERDRAALFKTESVQREKTNAETNRKSELLATQEKNSQLLSRLNSSNLLDANNAFNIDGKALRAGIEAGDGAIIQLGLDLVNQSGKFGEGVEAVGFDVIAGGGIAVRTKNSKGEDGVATEPADPEANGNVIMLEAGKLGGIANTLYRTSIITGLPKEQRDAFSAYRGDMNLIEREEAAINKAYAQGGQDQERAAVALIATAETDEEREEAVKDIEQVVANQASASGPQSTSQGPDLAQEYDGPITLEEVDSLGITPEQFAAATPEAKAEMLQKIQDIRSAKSGALSTGGRIGAFGADAALAPYNIVDSIREGVGQTRLGRMMGAGFGREAEYPDFSTNQRKVSETIAELDEPISGEDLSEAFTAYDKDPDYKRAAQQKQLDRLNKIDTADLTPPQVKRKAELEQSLAPEEATAAPANGPVSQAAPNTSKQLDGKTGPEINAAIESGDITGTQEEAAAVARSLQDRGIKDLKGLYESDLEDVEMMKALAFMRLFNSNASIDAQLAKEINNVSETGLRSMDTPQAITSQKTSGQAEREVAQLQIAAVNANTQFQKLMRSRINDDNKNVRTAATDIQDVLGDVFKNAYDEGGRLVEGRSTAAKIFNTAIPELDALAASATTKRSKEMYAETRNQALSLAIQALASDGGTGLDYFTEMFREDPSGSPRSTLNNLVSDGERFYYQEPDGQGNYRNVGAGISYEDLVGVSPQLAMYLAGVALANEKARKQDG